MGAGGGALTMANYQRLLLVIVSILVGASRLTAISQTMWEWDEAQFASAVRSYDVALHHPHPPGYPLFIAAAKLAHFVVADEFRSLQVVVVAASLLLFPLLFAFAREAGFRFGTALCGAALFAFLPNVWYYGGTGFSDIPATALAIAACTLLLRGRRSRSAFIAGGILLAISTGFRPQNLLLGCAPAIAATLAQWKSSARVVLATIALSAAVVVASYGGAAIASASPRQYVEGVREQQKWVEKVDSFRNPYRPDLVTMAWVFFVKPVDHRRLMTMLAVLAAISLVAGVVTRRAPVLWTIAVFAPFAVFAWLMLDHAAVSRYSVGYFAMHALLAADTLGAGFLARVHRETWSRANVASNAVQLLLAALLTTSFIRWTRPALDVVRHTDAPNVAAMKWIRSNVDRNVPLFVFAGLGPFSDFYFHDRRVQIFDSTSAIVGLEGRGYAVVDGEVAEESIVAFRREEGRIWKIARQRYFASAVVAMSNNVLYGDGWYADESDGNRSWRWMGKESHATLPQLEGRGRLTLAIGVPLDALASPPTIVLEINGRVVDSFVARERELVRQVVAESRHDGPNELKITTSGTARAAGDARDLGLVLRGCSWRAVQ